METIETYFDRINDMIAAHDILNKEYSDEDLECLADCLCNLRTLVAENALHVLKEEREEMLSSLTSVWDDIDQIILYLPSNRSYDEPVTKVITELYYTNVCLNSFRNVSEKVYTWYMTHN